MIGLVVLTYSSRSLAPIFRTGGPSLRYGFQRVAEALHFFRS